MADDLPQIYLVTPSDFELSAFLPRLEACLDALPVACLRLALSGSDEGRIGRAADGLREAAHARDVPIVIESHGLIAKSHGLDGVHLTDGARQVKAWRKEFGEDGIVGTFCEASRHEGMNAGELGADYVAFGPAGASALGRGEPVDPELFAWWSQMIEVPVIAEGALDEGLIRALAPMVDFLALGEEIWREDDAAAALTRLAAARG
ncbi:thiamine phosphate synthase [Pseudoroseicyclus sp. CXY001]|uniref:thiamine phosphate synthase n=1 Tax=Pseudoroseicyclus sp. CXY001 TaxID=3242492 RepID=UPI00358DA835